MKKFFLLIILFSATAFAQLRRADRLFKRYAYTEAAVLYKKYLNNHTNPKPVAIKNAADAYYYTGQIKEALQWYQKLYTVQGATLDSIHYMRYVDVLRANRQQDKADELLWKWLSRKKDITLTQKMLIQRQYLDSISLLPAQYKITNLQINTDKADFAPILYRERLVYTSAKDSVKNKGRLYEWNRQPYLSLYVSDINTDGSVTDSQKFLADAATGYHNGAAAFSPDYNTVYISVNNLGENNKLKNAEDGTNNLQLIYGTLVNDSLTDVKLAPFCNVRYSVGQANVSPDGKWLYFVSDMPGGYGATDIYRTEIYDNGGLGAPHNLGPEVNTAGREMFPFMASDTLYFASDGHYGFGGLDIFKSALNDDGVFLLPQNVGMPINSNRDDFAYIEVQEGNSGYFSSNRNGGKGDDDIYFFRKEESLQSITGNIFEKDSINPINNAKITVNYEGIEKTAETHPLGDFQIYVPKYKPYSITIAADGFATVTKNFEAGETPDEGSLNLQSLQSLVKKEDGLEKIAINPIYFDFDKHYITAQAQTELDKVVAFMMNFHKVIIKIESHTDSRGSDAYNLKLSNQRATATYNYIVSKGISPARISSVKGYGETRLLNDCGNGIDCTEEEHQLNRRSDFIITQK